MIITINRCHVNKLINLWRICCQTNHPLSLWNTQQIDDHPPELVRTQFTNTSNPLLLINVYIKRIKLINSLISSKGFGHNIKLLISFHSLYPYLFQSPHNNPNFNNNFPIYINRERKYCQERPINPSPIIASHYNPVNTRQGKVIFIYFPSLNQSFASIDLLIQWVQEDKFCNLARPISLSFVRLSFHSTVGFMSWEFVH